AVNVGGSIAQFCPRTRGGEAPVHGHPVEGCGGDRGPAPAVAPELAESLAVEEPIGRFSGGTAGASAGAAASSGARA
ncbi:unnamed protein product, partial [Prorocentrum cordatum]